MFFFADAIFGTKLSRNSVVLAVVASPERTPPSWRSQAATALYSPMGRDYLTPVAHPWLAGSACPSPAPVAYSPDHPPRRAGPALFGHRARDRAWLRRPPAGRPDGPRRRPSQLEPDQAHRLLHDDPPPAHHDPRIHGGRRTGRRPRWRQTGARGSPQLSPPASRRHPRLAG